MDEDNVEFTDNVIFTIEDKCKTIRDYIEKLKYEVCGLQTDAIFEEKDCVLDGANIPNTRNANMKENISLAFRSLEDARMRLGKVMQAYQGGISIFDREKTI